LRKPAYSLKQQEYDRFKRNKESKRIYNTDAWKRARLMQLRAYPLCHDCLEAGRYTPATLVHHVDELTAAPYLALDPENFRSLCASCHSRLHATKETPLPDASACTPGEG